MKITKKGTTHGSFRTNGKKTVVPPGTDEFVSWDNQVSRLNMLKMFATINPY